LGFEKGDNRSILKLQMQDIMSKPYKRRAPLPQYVSDRQLQISGFDTPFSQHLDPDNRWVVLAKKIPWDELAGIYLKQFRLKSQATP
jgi:hypothetical protein